MGNESEIKKQKRIIICLTGMPGAGKSTIASSLKEKGFPVITMGDVVREEANRQNLEPTDYNLGSLMLKLRRDLGPGAIAHLILRKMERDYNNNIDVIIIDGIRSMPEVEVLKSIGYVKLLAIHASTNTRFAYTKERARPDCPSSIQDFVVRDKRELTVGISEAIALADETLSNNDLTIEELKEKGFEIIQKWIAEINKSDSNSTINHKGNNIK
ncbi:MAG TPA: AAA family ATPase [Nitrososphaeraceae archaeon]|jgi:dephospho-CoA kinase|nr:AAA family ATPase [Nitrososphaeraceae archaeon]